MSIRVGSVINIMKAYGTYQTKLKYYNLKLEEAQKVGDEQGIKYWGDTIAMTEAEVGEFLNVII